ncbi:AmmeMemoRadiSam system protein B [Microgenomates group bacterium RBG_16_45_19]|nr:MAG: AmmeMemoRadiSam system protein B [Microgenomates group bacterium RBG_16_45_19]
MVRPPAVAGIFYPDSKEQLSQLLKPWLVESRPRGPRPVMLVAPHAGIIYSGQVAGSAYQQLIGQRYRRVMILGVSHQANLPYAVVDDHIVWETPLGPVATDKKLVNLILVNQLIRKEGQPHLDEHSLEMQLIFLQQVLGSSFTICPILLGQINLTTGRFIGQKLATALDQDTLLVISSDLAHYPPAEVAVKTDNQVIEAFIQGIAESFLDRVRQVEEAGYPGLVTAACGAKAMAVGLMAGKIIGPLTYQLQAYAHSGQVAGDQSRVVGYAAITGYKK